MVFNEETLDHISEISERTTSRLSDVTITKQSVLSGLLRYNSNKTPDPDTIHPCLLRTAQPVSVNSYITCLTNHPIKK